MRISPQKWRAFVINVFGSATEFPGVVHYLADSLSRAGLSILHISTFEYEVFLVQEQDIDKACAVFRRSDSPTELLTFIQGAQKKRTSSGGGNHVSTNSTGIGQSTTGHSSSQRFVIITSFDTIFTSLS